MSLTLQDEILKRTSKEASENSSLRTLLTRFHPVSLAAREYEDEISVT